MMLLHSEGAWIAIGISFLFIVVALVQHRLFVRVLKNGLWENAQHG